MTVDRRTVLLGLAGLAVAPVAARAAKPQRLLGARADAAGACYVTGFDSGGTIAFDLPLPTRGHGLAVRRDGGEAVLFARRPGSFALVLDPQAGRPIREIPAMDGCWFNGHGAYDAAGGTLYASETIAATGEGVIGVYDTNAGYRRLGEFSSGGLDPHDIRLLPDGRTLVVANGGILTHPDAPGVQLNLDSMQPSLAHLDAATGTLRQEVRLAAELHQLGIRHLAIAADNTVAIAMQFAGPSTLTMPLVGTHRPGAAAIELLPLEDALLARLRGYCGSAAVDASGTVLGVTSPRGNLAVFWDLAGERMLGAVSVADGCGIAADGGDGFLLASGIDGMFLCRPGDAAPRRMPMALTGGARWDNHLAALPAAG